MTGIAKELRGLGGVTLAATFFDVGPRFRHLKRGHLGHVTIWWSFVKLVVKCQYQRSSPANFHKVG
jgi:hypothetical protein